MEPGQVGAVLGGRLVSGPVYCEWRTHRGDCWLECEPREESLVVQVFVKRVDGVVPAQGKGRGLGEQICIWRVFKNVFIYSAIFKKMYLFGLEK